MLISRRGLITGLGSLLAAPAIVRASSLMPVKAWTRTMTVAEIVNAALTGPLTRPLYIVDEFVVGQLLKYEGFTCVVEDITAGEFFARP